LNGLIIRKNEIFSASTRILDLEKGARIQSTKEREGPWFDLIQKADL
jgi:hypothetical protein